MKLITTTIIAAALTFTATAQANVREYCGSLAEFAGIAAEVRDEGHAEWEARAAIGTGHPQATNDLNAIVTRVYTRPHLEPSVEASEAFDACIQAYATAL